MKQVLMGQKALIPAGPQGMNFAQIQGFSSPAYIGAFRGPAHTHSP